MIGMIHGLIVIDEATKDTSLISHLQSEQTIARLTGTVSAILLALPVSGCGTKANWDDRTVLLFSSIIPVLAALASFLVSEPGIYTKISDVQVTNLNELDEINDEIIQQKSSFKREIFILFVPTLILFELLAITNKTC